MKSALLLPALALLGLVCATSALAQPQDYIGGNLTWTTPRDAEFEYRNTDFQLDSSYDSNVGFGLVFGKVYDNNLRLEGDLAYRNNDLDAFEQGGEVVGAAGDITALSFTLNTYYDLVNPSRFTPYFGGGIGGTYVNLDGRTAEANLEDLVFSDEAFAFAYQLGAGVACRINRQVSLDLGYRYFSAVGLKFKDQDILTTDALGNPLNRFETDYSTHNVSLGLRLAF